MKRLFYLLIQRKHLNIAISQYVNFDLSLNNKNKIDYGIDNHFAFNKNQYFADNISQHDLLGIWDVKQVKQFVEAEFEYEKEIALLKEEVKTNMQYALQWELKPDAETEYILNNIIEQTTEVGTFKLNDKVSLCLDNINQKYPSTTPEFKFNIVLTDKQSNKNLRKTLNQSNIDTLKCIEKIVSQNKDHYTKLVDKKNTELSFSHADKQTKFTDLCKKYLPLRERDLGIK